MAINFRLRIPKALVGIITPTTPIESALDVSLELPLPTLEAACDRGLIVTLPTLDASGYAGGVGGTALDVTLPTLEATCLQGSASTASLNIPAPTLLAAVESSFNLDIPAPTLSATCLTGSIGSLDVTLKKIALAAEGYAGSVSTATLTVPLITLDADASAPSVSTVDITIPVLRLTATAHGPTAPVQEVLVMNTDTTALSNYSNWAFNSMTEFNGVFLGASDSGIYALTGDLDQAAVINATLKLGIHDFGDERLKRAEGGIYAGYRTDGSLTLTVNTDEGTTHAYTLTRRQTDKLHTSRVKVGKGIKGRYWQLQIDNVSGADFDMDDLNFQPNPIKRRI